jgi:hypothetical protein
VAEKRCRITFIATATEQAITRGAIDQPYPAPDLFDDAVIADPLGHVVEVVQRGRLRAAGQHRRGIIGLSIASTDSTSGSSASTS